MLQSSVSSFASESFYFSNDTLGPSTGFPAKIGGETALYDPDLFPFGLISCKYSS